MEEGKGEKEEKEEDKNPPHFQTACFRVSRPLHRPSPSLAIAP